MPLPKGLQAWAGAWVAEGEPPAQEGRRREVQPGLCPASPPTCIASQVGTPAGRAQEQDSGAQGLSAQLTAPPPPNLLHSLMMCRALGPGGMSRDRGRLSPESGSQGGLCWKSHSRSARVLTLSRRDRAPALGS